LKKLRIAPPEQLSLLLDIADAAPAPLSRAIDDTRARRIHLDHGVVSYRLRRARRRSIGFQIDDQGLTVSAPRWVPLREIEAAIVEKRRWIVAKQREWHEWRARRRLPVVRFVDGAALPYLGGHVTMRIDVQYGATRLVDADLRLSLPREVTELQVRDTVQAWLQAEARRVFAERITRFAGRISTRYAGWTLSSARSQWGSCTHDGRIRLSWRLIHFALPVIDYVVAHELAHLEELNHGARFWSAVSQLLPGFEGARDQIRQVDVAALPL
jgi:predicted metal-dependent hydrolase